MQKNIWPVLIITAVFGLALFIGFRSASKHPEGKAPATAPGSASSDHATSSISPDSADAASSSPAAASSSKPATLNQVTAPRAPVTTLSALQRTHEEINAAADSTTPESLALLVSYATDENADIRTPALNGLIRRGDADAAPFLRAAAKKTDSSEVAISLLKTADYLELPAATLHEIASRPRLPKENPLLNPKPPALPQKPTTPDPEDKP